MRMPHECTPIIPRNNTNFSSPNDFVMMSVSHLILRSHMPPTAVEAATNSASTMDRETDVCFFNPQDTAPGSNITIKPEMDFLSTRSPAQSESINTLSDEGVELSLWNSSM